MTRESGSSGGGSSSSSSGSSSSKEKNKTKSVSKSTGQVTTGTIDSLSSSGGDYLPSYQKAPASTVAGTGDAKIIGGAAGGSSINTGSSIPQSIASSGGGGGSKAIDTTVNQRPAENAPPTTDGVENTTITATPRSDFSVVLAGQTGTRPNRGPARSNNFVSLIGGAGGLGRRTSEAKRTLIGGA